MKSRSGRLFQYYLELSKLKIMIPVCLTGFTGYFVFAPAISPGIFLTSLGILLLSISASVLNQVQEHDLDSKMNRTRNRPIPAKKIKIYQALLFSVFNLFAGSALLYSAGNLKAVIIGLFTIFWYNVIYTCSKRITAFAVVPGALTGALPPLIGWVAAGGGIWDKPIIFIEFLFFTGQIPHFWLLILKYGHEYQQAGIPSLTSVFNTAQIRRLTFMWVVTSASAALFLCTFEIIRSAAIICILLISSVLLIWQFYALIKKPEETLNKSRHSILLYSYFFLVIILLITDRILR